MIQRTKLQVIIIHDLISRTRRVTFDPDSISWIQSSYYTMKKGNARYPTLMFIIYITNILFFYIHFSVNIFFYCQIFYICFYRAFSFSHGIHISEYLRTGCARGRESRSILNMNFEFDTGVEVIREFLQLFYFRPAHRILSHHLLKVRGLFSE